MDSWLVGWGRIKLYENREGMVFIYRVVDDGKGVV